MEKPIIVLKPSPVVRVKTRVKVSTIPNDYEKLKNLPSINGVELKGNLESSDLKILSCLLEKYENKTIDTAENGHFLLIKDNIPIELSLAEVIDYVKSFDTAKEVVVEDDGEVEQELKPNVFYRFTGALTALTLTFGEALADRENEYKGQFTVGDSIPSVSFPTDISWFNAEPEYETGKTYQFSVLNGIGVVIGV